MQFHIVRDKSNKNSLPFDKYIARSELSFMGNKSAKDIDMGASQDLPIKDAEAEGAFIPSTAKKVYKRKDIRRKYFPIFMLVISIIQVTFMYSVDNNLLAMLFGIDPHRRHEIWRYFTIMLVHSGLSHLWTNIIFQLILGILLEMFQGWKRIAIIYFSSILGGSLFVTVLRPHIYAVGASAGVYGLLFSHLSTIILNWNETNRKFSRLFWLLFYIIFDVSLSLYLEVVPKVHLNTSNPGHIEGGITGFLVSILMLKNLKIHPWERVLKRLCVGIIVALFFTIFLINVIATGYYLPTEWNFNYRRTYEHNISTYQYDFNGTIFGVQVIAERT